MFISCHEKGITQSLCFFFGNGLRELPSAICKKYWDVWGWVWVGISLRDAIFPQCVLILCQKGIFSLILGVLRKFLGICNREAFKNYLEDFFR